MKDPSFLILAEPCSGCGNWSGYCQHKVEIPFPVLHELEMVNQAANIYEYSIAYKLHAYQKVKLQKARESPRTKTT
jgi:hypothetical protein